jgi:hypothetical protein
MSDAIIVSVLVDVFGAALHRGVRIIHGIGMFLVAKLRGNFGKYGDQARTGQRRCSAQSHPVREHRHHFFHSFKMFVIGLSKGMTVRLRSFLEPLKVFFSQHQMFGFARGLWCRGCGL